MKSPTPQWQRFEQQFTSSTHYSNPAQETMLTVTFTSPSAKTQTVGGFWDGGEIWRVRFAPDEIGQWTYRTHCSNEKNGDLHGQSGTFECSAPQGETLFEQHGPLRLSANRRYLTHADGTPFFFLSDTAWNGPLRSRPDEWNQYLSDRVRQKFTAVQWVATQWLAAPDGDWRGEKAFSGIERIEINPIFFQQLDAKMDAINRAGLLSVPVLLWSASGSAPEVNASNPGYALPEGQAILLAQYMVNRWGAYNVVWILPGDSDYRGPLADRWKRIGRAVFGDKPHAPVSLHPRGMQWNLDEFRDELWLDILGYQSGHGDSEETLAWLVTGPPATTWPLEPHRPIINLEPPYENHLAYHSRQPHSAHNVRRGLYWSLLVSPTAGVTYGGHGVWGWDDGTQPPVAHPTTGIPLPWQKALLMEAAEQVAHVNELFQSLKWWELRPAQELILAQPGETDKRYFITASRSEAGDLAVIYTPEEQAITLSLNSMRTDVTMHWFDPRTGNWMPTSPLATAPDHCFKPPAVGDWLLVLHSPQPTSTQKPVQSEIS